MAFSVGLFFVAKFKFETDLYDYEMMGYANMHVMGREEGDMFCRNHGYAGLARIKTEAELIEVRYAILIDISTFAFSFEFEWN